MNKKIKKILKIIWIIAGLCAGVVFFACIFSIENPELIFNYILPTVFLMFVFFSTVTFIAIVMSKLGEVLGKKEYEKEKFSPVDKKNEEYYRDILKINTPLILGVVDNYDISIENVIAELLYLKKKNIIEFTNEKIIVLANDSSNLDEIHTYIIEHIGENGKFVFEKKGILTIALNGAKRLKIFEKALDMDASKNKIAIKAVIYSIIIFGLIIGIMGYIGNGNYRDALEVFATPATLIAAFFCYSYIRKYHVSTISVPYIRNKDGEKLNEKLEGLKKYLEDYSLLDEREVSALALWDEYLIYSVMFGQNKKIIDEYTKYIEMKE